MNNEKRLILHVQIFIFTNLLSASKTYLLIFNLENVIETLGDTFKPDRLIFVDICRKVE